MVSEKKTVDRIWTDEERGVLKYMLENNYTYNDIGRKLNRTWQSIRKCADRLRKSGAVRKVKNEYGWLMDEGQKIKKYDELFKIKTNNAIIYGDVHAPFVNIPFTIRKFEVAKKFKTRTVIIAGDFFDQLAYSHFDKRDKTTWESEKEFARVFTNHLIQDFDNIYILLGNHDVRLLRMLEFNENFKELFLLITQDPKVKVSDYPMAEVNGDWLIIHPKSYSQVSGSVARRLAEKYHKNIITAHGHFCSTVFDRSGKYYCIDVGGLVDRGKVEYIAHNITTHPSWNNSFVVLYKNSPYIFHERTDWDFWKKVKL